MGKADKICARDVTYSENMRVASWHKSIMSRAQCEMKRSDRDVSRLHRCKIEHVDMMTFELTATKELIINTTT